MRHINQIKTRGCVEHCHPHFVIWAMTIILIACQDDATSTGETETDCRNNGVGCTEGFRCQRNIYSEYECLEWEEPNTLPLPMSTTDAGMPLPMEAQAAPIAPSIEETTDMGTETDMAADDADEPVEEPSSLDGATSTEDCRRVTVQLKPQVSAIPKMILVVDRSPSMKDILADGTFGPDDRWSPTVGALIEMTRSLDDVIAFGLMLFPNPITSQSCIEGEVNISPELGTADRIATFLNRYPPIGTNGGTPTALSLRLAGNFLINDVISPGERSLLLATDGGPGCNAAIPLEECSCLGEVCSIPGAYNPENCLDANRTIRAVTTVAEQGVRTFVLGITSPFDFNEAADAVLDRMAVAGGTALDGRHYSVRGSGGDAQLASDLNEAFRVSAGGVVPCIYDGGNLQPFEAFVEVTVDDEVVPRDPNGINGWDLRQGDLEFFGPACAALRDGETHRITASCVGG